MHPHILIYLIGHDLLARLRGVLHGSVHAEVISELDRWSQAVLQAAMSFRCDSQLGLSQRLGEDEVPLPLSAQQRSNPCQVNNTLTSLCKAQNKMVSTLYHSTSTSLGHSH